MEESASTKCSTQWIAFVIEENYFNSIVSVSIEIECWNEKLTQTHSMEWPILCQYNMSILCGSLQTNTKNQNNNIMQFCWTTTTTTTTQSTKHLSFSINSTNVQNIREFWKFNLNFIVAEHTVYIVHFTINNKSI